MRLSTVVMAHPSRARFVKSLRRKLGGVPVVWDDGSNDRWKTGAACLQHHLDAGAEFALTVQDDAIPCRDLVAGCEKLTAYSGDRPVGLYVGRVRPYQRTVTPAVARVLQMGSPWLSMPGPWWGVGIVVPTVHIPELLKWGAANRRIANYDRRIARWYETQRIDCWYTVPSLVDHRPVDENPSLIEGRTGNRRAHTFMAGSALDVDWSLPPVTLDDALRARFRRRDTGVVAQVSFGSAKYRAMSRNPRWILEEPDVGDAHFAAVPDQAAA